jgi:hypothetical protein
MATVEIHYSLEVAYLVLEHFRNLPCDEKIKFTVQSFSNGREQGLCLVKYGGANSRQVAFAQQRNSDEIVVYYGNGYEFDVSTNMPTKWNQRKYFGYGEYKEAAQFMLDYLLS